MPIGIQRLNAKKSQPNPLIIFIKPLKGPDESIAQDFLERIAAQCLPVMRDQSLSVMSLEEYEPNREFVGRNFNAGEVVQLVLKSRSGRWLPFNYVQMVMMHELAHCKQMNHSRAFWALRNNYANQMRQLWSHGYTGEGLWGRGALLTTGEFETNTVQDDEVLPEHLCGGTYRSRRRKRKVKDQLTYQQQKERRILKKFGPNGVPLGDDEMAKAELEKGKRVQARPRVANSKRGRELRAAAALARFDQQKKTEEDVKLGKDRNDTDETGSDYDTTSEDGTDGPGATDINGEQLLDGKGHRMIKVCEDENPEDDNAQNELRELQSSLGTYTASLGARVSGPVGIKRERNTPLRLQDLPIPDVTTSSAAVRSLNTTTSPGPTLIKQEHITQTASESETKMRRTKNLGNKQYVSTITTYTSPPGQLKTNVPGTSGGVAESAATSGDGICPMCSTVNGAVCLTCAVCAHVLDCRKDPRAWRCASVACEGSRYLNAGDAGLCGVCGERKPGL